MPFSRRQVNIDLEALLDKYEAALSIKNGLINVLLSENQHVPNQSTIRINDEQEVYFQI